LLKHLKNLTRQVPVFQAKKVSKITWILSLFFLLFTRSAFAQLEVQGYVYAFDTQEPAFGAVIEWGKRYSVTDDKGKFSIENGFLKDSIEITYFGYKRLRVAFTKELKKYQLEPKIERLSVVEINQFNTKQITRVESGKIEYNAKAIENLPFILGEKDVLKFLQYTPGVQQAKEGQSGLLVRGGNGSMNLTYIDGVYLHNTSHLGGLFTAINSDFIQKMTFSKSGFDARYGGRLSSITEVSTKDNFDSFFVTGNLGMITSKITTGVVLQGIKTNVLYSGRRTYLELIQPLYQNKITKNDNSLLGEGKRYYFYDNFFKTQTQLNTKNQLSFLFYQTLDSYKDGEGLSTKNTEWENQLLGFQWKSKLSNSLSSLFSFGKSSYQLNFNGAQFPYTYEFHNSYETNTAKQVFKLRTEKQIFHFGSEYNSVKNRPRKIEAAIQDTPLLVENQQTYLYDDLSLFVDDNIQITDLFKIKLGLRYTNFNGLYNVFEPRINTNYQFSPNQFLKFSYQKLYQFVHQAALSSQSTPIDFYLPSNNSVKPQESQQISLGYGRVFDLFSVEIDSYFKDVKNYIEFKNGSLHNLFTNDIYGDISVGKLISYGVEFSVKYQKEKMTAHLSYTYSKSEAQFDDINYGKKFPVVFDRPHNFNVLLNYQVNKKWTLGALFLLTSGQTYSPAKDIRIINEEAIITFGHRNSYRYPAYHRLDLSATYLLREKKGWTSKLNLTLYNVYNRKNPFYINYKVTGSTEENFIESEAVVETLFPFIPTLSWIFNYK
jgi:hypothetical protein